MAVCQQRDGASSRLVLAALEERFSGVISSPSATYEQLEFVVSAIREMPADCDAERQLVLLRDVLRHLAVRGDESLHMCEVAELAVNKARQGGADASVCRTLRMSSMSLMFTQQYTRALECLAESLELAVALDLPIEICKALMNVGSFLEKTFQYAKALMVLDIVVQRYLVVLPADEEFWTCRGLILLNASHMRLRLAALEGSEQMRTSLFERALLDVHQAKELLREQKVHEYFSRKRWTVESNHAQICLGLGRIEEAVQRARRCVEVARADGAKDGEFVGLALVTICEVDGANLERSLAQLTAIAERVYQWKAHDVGLWAELKEMVALCFARAGHPEKALRILKELSVIVGQAQIAGIVSSQALHLQHVGVGDGDGPFDASGAFERHSEKVRLQVARREDLRREAEHSVDGLREWLHLSTDPLQREAIIAELPIDAEGEHCFRVGRLSALLATAAGVDERSCVVMDVAARLHDVGMMTLSTSLLQCRAAYNGSQRELLKLHAAAGAEIIRRCGLRELRVAEEIALHHHERWNGDGYPHGISGHAIPFAARIVAIVDAFDAMTHPRAYRAAVSVDVALGIISSLAGSDFDPRLCELFVELVQDLRARHPDLDVFLTDDPLTLAYRRSERSIERTLRVLRLRSEESRVAEVG